MQDFHASLNEVAQAVDLKIDELLPEAGRGDMLAEAMRYSTLMPGKRIRPFLVLKTSNLFGVNYESAIQVAAAIEMIHSFSLIHDDLPAMDDDDFRRGQPSCHKKFTEAAAILAGDALMVLAFEVLADSSTHLDGLVRLELITMVSKAVGASGMIGGQMLDMVIGDNPASEELIRLHRMKTGELFVASIEAGAVMGKAPRNFRIALKGYAQAIGLAFQITDDLIDYNENKDLIEHSNYVKIMGVEKAREQSRILSEQAIEHLHLFDHIADPLRDLARFINERTT